MAGLAIVQHKFSLLPSSLSDFNGTKLTSSSIQVSLSLSLQSHLYFTYLFWFVVCFELVIKLVLVKLVMCFFLLDANWLHFPTSQFHLSVFPILNAELWMPNDEYLALDIEYMMFYNFIPSYYDIRPDLIRKIGHRCIKFY